MRKYTRKFFWLVVSSAAGLVLMSLNPTSMNALKSGLGMIKHFKQQNSNSSAPALGDTKEIFENLNRAKSRNEALESAYNIGLDDRDRAPSSLNRIAPPEDLKAKLRVVKIVDGVIQRDKPQVESYVRINGKYLKYREDNTYYVNGEKIFHLDGRKYSKDEIMAPRPEAQASSDPLAKIQETLSRGKASPVPTSVNQEELMQQVMRTQEAVERNRQYLNQITDEN